ncbi:MAG: uncharacterized protein KVP18_003646 [Porospora cf. gigantea A]|uniref:uncharacterized protein n=1 Tax=Porospora cf. gigantea A TaxID=2853593 RepID=UPI00355A0309|nr:MAG: hypothetical protein KVP18_003646 [Porospora cf. gigantea A]
MIRSLSGYAESLHIFNQIAQSKWVESLVHLIRSVPRDEEGCLLEALTIFKQPYSMTPMSRQSPSKVMGFDGLPVEWFEHLLSFFVAPVAGVQEACALRSKLRCLSRSAAENLRVLPCFRLRRARAGSLWEAPDLYRCVDVTDGGWLPLRCQPQMIRADRTSWETATKYRKMSSLKTVVWAREEDDHLRWIQSPNGVWTENANLVEVPTTVSSVVVEGEGGSAVPIASHIQVLVCHGSFQGSLSQLPNSIKSLSILAEFSRPLAGLPSQLACLTLGSFDCSISLGELPASLRYLNLGDCFDRPLLPGSLPPRLQVLTFGVSFNQEIPLGVLPCSLRNLTFGHFFNHEVTSAELPPLRTLTFGRQYHHPLHALSLPRTLETLFLGGKFNSDLEPGMLPSSLLHLHLGVDFNRPLSDGVLPSQLQRLVLSRDFDCALTANSIPSSVTHLTFGAQFSQELASLPPKLKSLALDGSYSRPFYIGVLPSSLTDLRMGLSSTVCLQNYGLPNLQRLQITLLSSRWKPIRETKSTVWPCRRQLEILVEFQDARCGPRP